MGLRTGLVRTVISVVGIAAAIVLASQFFSEAAPIFDGLLDSENGASVLGFLLIFVVVLVISAIVGSTVSKVANLMMLGWINQGGGLVLGVLLSFTLLSALLSMVDSFPVLSLDATISESVFGSFLVEDFDVVLKGLKLLPDDLTEKLT